jgi:hypothetical protein
VVDTNAQAFARLYQVVHWELLPIVHGQTVRFGAWVRAAPGQPLRLAVRDDRQLSRVYGRGTGEWQRMDVLHPVAADTTELRVLISPGLGEAVAETGTVEVDDAWLTLADGQDVANLLRNPGLEQGTTWGSRLWKPLLERYVQPWLAEVRLVLVRPLRVSWMAAQAAPPVSGTRCAGGLCVSCTHEWCWRVLYAALLFAGFWGNFGWLNVPLPLPLYAILAVGSGLAVGGVLRRAWHARRWSPAERATWCFPVRVAQWAVLAVALAGLAVLTPLVLWGWQPQARYVYPILLPIVFLGAVGLRYWAQHWRLRHGLVWYLASLLALDLYALLAVVMPAYIN